MEILTYFGSYEILSGIEFAVFFSLMGWHGNCFNISTEGD
jgi:hypothetical protein